MLASLSYGRLACLRGHHRHNRNIISARMLSQTEWSILTIPVWVLPFAIRTNFQITHDEFLRILTRSMRRDSAS